MEGGGREGEMKILCACAVKVVKGEITESVQSQDTLVTRTVCGNLFGSAQNFCAGRQDTVKVDIHS